MKCPKCSSMSYIKSGFNGGKQRYCCKDCGRYFVTSSRYRLPEKLRRQAIQLYLEGLGFRSIERILGVSNVTVMRWVRDLGQELKQMRKQEAGEVLVMELDEVWHWVGQKNKNSGCGSLMIEMENKSLTSSLVGVISPRHKGSGKD